MTSILALAWRLDAERPETLFTFQLSGCSPGAIQPRVRSIGQPIRHPSSGGISFATGRMSWSGKKKPLSGHRDSYSCLTTQLLQSPRSITIRCYANCAPVYLSLRTSVHTHTHLTGPLSLMSEETYRWSGDICALLLVASVFDELMAQNLHLTFRLRSVNSECPRTSAS